MNRFENAKVESDGNVTLIGEDGHTITLQPWMLEDLVLRVKIAGRAKQEKIAGEWAHIAGYTEPRTLNVGVLSSTQGERIALTLDRGLVSEHTLSFDQSAALALSEELAATAARIESNKPVKQ